MHTYQTTVLDEAAQAHPDSWWWLKADGCDIISGLKESTMLQWNGDVDLNDGSLQQQYHAYRKRLTFIENIGENRECTDIVDHLSTISTDISDDLGFIHSGNELELLFMHAFITLFLYSPIRGFC